MRDYWDDEGCSCEYPPTLRGIAADCIEWARYHSVRIYRMVFPAPEVRIPDPPPMDIQGFKDLIDGIGNLSMSTPHSQSRIVGIKEPPAE